MKIRIKNLLATCAAVTGIALCFPNSVKADQGDVELAQRLANPIANLISVPLQLNYDENIGPNDEGSRWILNVQPVIPFRLSPDLLVISRTIVPLVFQDQLFPGSGYQSGLGDILQSLFFSPLMEDPTLTIGAGPVMLFPTATDDLLGSEKWGAGPTAVIVKLKGQLTYGALLNHIWSFAGNDNRNDISSTFIQPFISYTNTQAWTFSLTSETSYDWNAEDAQMPINLVVTKLTKIGDQKVSVGGGVRYWADSFENGPDGWGYRAVFTMLFPN